MDEIITVDKLTWDACSNDVFGFCANHPFHEYQLDNYLSIRKLQNAGDKKYTPSYRKLSGCFD